MILTRRRRVYSPWTNYGCLNVAIATFTGLSDAELQQYLAAVKLAFPPTPGAIHWVRETRLGIAATTSIPAWNTAASRYWTNMYAEPTASDIMSTRKIIFDPILWIRPDSATAIVCNPNAAPNPFGRNSSGVQVVADVDNTWRRDMRLNLDRLCWSDVGTASGEPWSTRAETTNFSVFMILGPAEIDNWNNIRVRYVTDTEAGVPAYSAASRASVSALAGTAGKQTLFLRIYDNMRHIFDWAREKRPDVGIVYSCATQASRASAFEFNEYEKMNFAHPGAGLVIGCVNDVCDAHQFHQTQQHDRIPNPWDGSIVSDTVSSAYNYWKAAEEVRTWRLANGYADTTRPLLATEHGYNYDSDGTVVGTRTDLFQLRRLKTGMMVLGQLYYGCCLINYFTVSRGTLPGYNLINPTTLAYYGGASPDRDADYVFQSMDMREVSDDISFTSKTWTNYWKDWQVWFDTNATPLGTASTTCPFPEWNRVTMTSVSVTMIAGGRNRLARKKNLYSGTHTFTAEVKLSATGSQACLRVSGHDKLNGLNLVSSNVLAGIQDWTKLSVTFSPRQHGNRRVPDPPVCVLMIDHNGTGTCEVRNPLIGVGGSSPIIVTYFDFEAVDVSWTPTSPAQGQAVTFSATIKNIGNGSSPSGIILGVAFRIDGTNVSWSDNNTNGMAPGETRVQVANSGPVGTATWAAVGGQHTIAAVVDDINRFPSESIKTNNTVTKTITVSLPSGPQVPPQASAAGLNALYFNDDFTSLSFYHPVTKPDGTWRFNDFYQSPDEAGYLDFAGLRTFMVNQMMSGNYNNVSNPERNFWGDAAAKAAFTPYFPASQLDSTTMRLRCTRARLSERPTIRNIINSITTISQGQNPDQVTWLGAFLTTEKTATFAPADITRPAYLEARMRFTPTNIMGIFSSFWVFDTAEVSGSPEIDIFESNDHNWDFWKTNIHHSASGPSFNLRHEQNWDDGQFHTFGMLWEPSSLKIYYDDVLSNQLTGANADFFSMPMRLMITHTCDAHYAVPAGTLVPTGIEDVYMDIDYIRVWKTGGPAPTTAIAMSNRAHMANVGQSSGTLRNVLWRTAFFASKRASMVQVRLVYANSYLDGGIGENAGLNTIYVTSSIEYNGTTKPVTFSGAREVTLVSGAVVMSDYITITIPASAQFWIRQNVRTANANEKFPTGYTALASLGEGYTSTNALAGVDVAGPISNAIISDVFSPVAVLGVGDATNAPSVVVVGGSTAYGTGETFNTIVAPGDRGVFARIFSTNIGHSVLATPGNSLSQWQTRSTERMKVLNAIKPTHIVCALVTNDISVGETYAVVQARLQSVWANLASTGATIIQVTSQPLSDSSDGYTTLAGQSVAYKSVTDQINAYIRTKPSPIADILDYAAVVESSPNSGKWRVDGGPWTNDGTHTLKHAQAAYLLATDSMRIWGISAPNPDPNPPPPTTTSVIMANRGHMANSGQSGGGNRNVVFRTAFMSAKGFATTKVQAVFSNSYLDATGEHAGLNTIFVIASVEYNGVTVPLTFGGQREISLAPGALVISDYGTISIPENRMFWTRQCARTAAATEKYAVGYTTLPVLGEGYSITTPTTQVDATGILSANSTFGMFAPVAVMGE